MFVYIVQDGDREYTEGEVMAVFDNLASALDFVADYEAELDAGLENRSYDFFYRAANALFNGENVHEKFGYFQSCFIREMEVRE